MYERFSKRARQVVVLAREEARLFRRDQVGSEHLLLGVLAAAGPGAEALSAADVTVERARAEVARLVGSGATDPATAAPVRWTPEAKRVHDRVLRVALALRHAQITPEHLLVGLLETGDCTAARVLDGLQVPREQVRVAVVARLAAEGADDERDETIAGFFAEDIGLLLTAVHRLARDLANEDHRPVVDSGDLLLAVARLADGVAAGALAQLGVAPSALRDALERARQDADTDAPSE